MYPSLLSIPELKMASLCSVSSPSIAQEHRQKAVKQLPYHQYDDVLNLTNYQHKMKVSPQYFVMIHLEYRTRGTISRNRYFFI